MSYLQFPRLIFSGSFQADPSTVNNDPSHYNVSEFQPNYDESQGTAGPGTAASGNGWWNPRGTGAWRFKDCVVEQVQYQDGTVCTDPTVDPVVGMPINSVVDRVEGKLVDLDPEMQMVSAIWGFQVFLGSKSSMIGFGGDYATASFGDIWVRYPQGHADSFFGAYYQSVINLTKIITGANQSRYLKELAAVNGTGRQLSIRFNVDGYVDDTTAADFTFGRVTGAIGAYQTNEPYQFVSGRTILAQPPASPTSPALNTAYAIIQNNFLHLDLGNSLPTTAAGGELVPFGGSLGPINIAVNDNSGNLVILGTVPLTNAAWYVQTAGILSFPLSPNQLAFAQKSPISLIQLGNNTPNIVLGAEAANGQFVRADQFVFRFDPNQTKPYVPNDAGSQSQKQTAKFFATQFGRPLPNATISFVFDSSLAAGFVAQYPGIIPGPPVGTPTSALSFPNATAVKTGFTINTGTDGTVLLQISATDPKNPRGYIDGQIYGVAYQLGTTPPAIAAIQNPSLILNFLVFNQVKIPDHPTWIEDIQPILQQYADLYPVMKPIVDLGNFGSVMKNLHILRNVFSAPVNSPNYMPVTRDLSDSKKAILLKWIDKPMYMNLDSVPQLHKALQIAIELEHSTIPTYLTALYSLKPGANDQVASLIKGIVVEEMLHMSLACNILIAIGGKPNIGKPGFIPEYPGTLPGGLRTGLIVSLKKCSIEQIRDCFMSIEMPEEMLIERMRWLDPKLDGRMRANIANKSGQMEYAQYTIGWFYDQIKTALKNLSESGKIKFANEALQVQVKHWYGPGKLMVIKSLKDAWGAIDEITEQGEGRSPSDPTDGDTTAGGHYQELAHYYKFAEIVEGRQLIKSVAGGYAYTGPKIPFNPEEVWPMVDNPSLVNFPTGSRAAILSDQFAESYQAMLNSLNETFNGNPANLNNSIGAMYSIGLQAIELMQTDSGLGNGTTAGPKFQINFAAGN